MDCSVSTRPGYMLPNCGFSLSVKELFAGVAQKVTKSGCIDKKYLTAILTSPKEIYSLVGRFTSGVVKILGEIIQGDKAKFNEFYNSVQSPQVEGLVSRPRGPPAASLWASIAEAFKKG